MEEMLGSSFGSASNPRSGLGIDLNEIPSPPPGDPVALPRGSIPCGAVCGGELLVCDINASPPIDAEMEQQPLPQFRRASVTRFLEKRTNRWVRPQQQQLVTVADTRRASLLRFLEKRKERILKM